MAAFNFIKDRIDHHAKFRGDQVFLQSQNHVPLTFAELKSQLDFLAKKFQKSGLNENTAVVVYLPKGWAQTLFLIGLLYCEIPAMVISVESGVLEVEKILTKFPISALISIGVAQLEIQAGLSDVTRFELSNEQVELATISGIKAPTVDFRWLLQTSGSTGDAKAVMLSIENLEQRTLAEIDLFGIAEGGTLLNILPFSHDLGLNQLLTSIYSGSRLILTGRKLSVDLAREIVRNPQAGITGMPSIWTQFIQIVHRLKLPVHHEGFITVSGGSMTVENLAKLKSIFREARVVKTYGQTETFRTLAECNQSQVVAGDCGTALPGVLPLLVDEHYRPVAENEIGQLIHFGAGVMSGYWLEPELTQATLRSWDGEPQPDAAEKMGVLTGDLFKRLPQGRYEFIGRMDDIVKISGYRVHLGEIEASILRSGWAESACVLRRECSSLCREILVAFIVPKGTSPISRDKLVDHCMSELAAYQVPSEFVNCPALPLTSNFKVDRRTLMNDYDRYLGTS